jgi:hypothetical protein
LGAPAAAAAAAAAVQFVLTPLVLLELRLVRECDAVHSLQGLLAHVSTPESTTHIGYANRLHSGTQHHQDNPPWRNQLPRNHRLLLLLLQQ